MRKVDFGPVAREASPPGPLSRAERGKEEEVRRLDGRFLMPMPAEGWSHLVVLGGPLGIAEAARAAGMARRVSDTLPAAGTADALFVLAGTGVDPEEAARCLGPGGCAWIEPESRRWRPRGDRLRVTGVYAVLPDFGRHEAYVPLDPPGALRWYAETLQPAWTAGKALRRALGSVLLSRRLALTAVVGPENGGTILDHPALPSPLRGMRPLLLAHGPDRVVLLPFSPGGSSPEAALKVPRMPVANGKTEAEQEILKHFRGRLDAAARSVLPEPRGLYRAGGLSVALEGYARGRPLAQRVGSWGAPRRRKIEDLRDAADWLAWFHQRTEVRRAEWDAGQADEWVLEPLEEIGNLPPRLLAAVRERSATLTGVALPIVCQHRDFTPWNVLCGESGLRVIDWEGARPGPALCDLLHFSTHWSELALRAFDDRARLRVFERVWIAREGGEPGEAVRREVASYCAALRLDRLFVPLLLTATWAELAARAGAGSREAAYVGVLARGADELFRGWTDGG
jgi:Phosphotransferase enzyme family